ncbi:MAG: type II secretion system protein GspD [Betaproteobacteria bacterium]
MRHDRATGITPARRGLAFIVLVVAGAGLPIAPVHGQPNTPPPQVPATPSPWKLVRQLPAPILPRAILPINGSRALSAAPVAAAPGQVTLAEFLRTTLGESGRQAYVLMPSASVHPIVITADLSHFRGADPLPLVRQVLSNLGLTITEVSGVLVIHPETAPGGNPMDQELWVYTPKHRTIAALAGYFPLFTRLTFNYSASAVAHSTDFATTDPYGTHSRWAYEGQTPATGGPSLDIGGAVLTGQATGYGASVSALVPQSMATGFNTSPFNDPSQAAVPPNFLVVRGYPNDVQLLKSFLEQVDIQVPEVLLQAYVMEVRDTQSKDTAVQLIFSLLEGRLSGNMGTAAGDLSVLRLGGRDMALSIGRLTSDSRVRLISSPVLRASDGSVASVTIGTDTPTLGSIITYSGSSQQSVTYQSAGVLLNISPRILQESIRLLIWQELSSFVKTDTGLATTPTKLRRAFRSDVVARSGEVILLGGLSEFNQSQIKQGGFLGLGSTSKLDSQSEIVVLLQVQRLDGKGPDATP